MKYIDVHAHVFPPNIAVKAVDQLQTYYGYRWEGSGMLDDLTDSLESARIDKAVIFSSATKPAQVCSINNFISGLVHANPEQFIGFGTLHPEYADCLDEIKRMRDLGLVGLKFHPDFQRFDIDDPRMMRIYEAIGDAMPILFHTGDRRTDFSSPRRVEHLITVFPFLKVVAAHMGGYTEWEESWEHLVGRNVWFDTSSTLHFLTPSEVRKMVFAHGVDKILFASDYPAVHHRKAIDDVLSLGLSPEENEKVFYKNAEKLIGVTI